jgi:hypothetical protein
MRNKIGFWIALISVITFLSISFYVELSMKYYGTTCAKFVRISKGKSFNYYEFEYRVGDSVLVGVRSGTSLRIKNKELLKKMECIEIAYSKINLTNIRILDKKVGKEWLWFVK